MATFSLVFWSRAELEGQRGEVGENETGESQTEKPLAPFILQSEIPLLIKLNRSSHLFTIAGCRLARSHSDRVKTQTRWGYSKMEYVWVRLAISWHKQFYALKCHVYCYISDISCWIRSFTSDPITVKQPTGPSKSKHFSNQGLTAHWPTVTHHILSRPSAPYQEGALSPQSPQTRFVGVVVVEIPVLSQDLQRLADLPQADNGASVCRCRGN